MNETQQTKIKKLSSERLALLLELEKVGLLLPGSEKEQRFRQLRSKIFELDAKILASDTANRNEEAESSTNQKTEGESKKSER
jgi:hypothetical protein